MGDDIHDLRADALLGLAGGGADMGRAGDHGMAVKRCIGGGLVGIDIQTGARTLPEFSAASRAFSSTLVPREVLMMVTPSFILAMVLSLMMAPPSTAGAWTEIKSD